MKHNLSIIGAVLLAAALWFTGCSNSLLEKPETAQNNGGGTVAIRIGTVEERTLYPDLSSFTKYILSFTGSVEHQDEVISGGSASIELAAGQWTIIATAYTGTGDDEAATAQGSASVRVAEGVSTPVNITLGPITDAGTGTFSYAITLPASASTATLSLTNMKTEAPVPGLPDLKDQNTYTLDVAPGYYLMHIQLTNAAGETAGLSEVVHIYSGLTTTTTGAAYNLSDVVWTTVTSVIVSPAPASVAKGGTQAFTATVTGTNSPAQTVTWSVSGGGAGTAIEANTGVLTVAAGETAATLTVRASSTVDAAKSGTATVTVADVVVNMFDLTDLVPAPVSGDAPETAINTAQYTGTIAWQTSDGTAFTGSTFAAATVYKALVTLSARSGYTFTGVSENSFTYTGGTVTNPANSGTVTIDFSSTAAAVVNALNLTMLVTTPLRGAAPVTTAIDETQYTGSIAWQTSDGTAFTGPSFAPSTVYRALVTLGTKSGYTFAGVAANSFTYTGGTVTNTANSGTVIITFPLTGPAQDVVVSDFDLTTLVITPVATAAPDTTPINSPEYTGTIAWYTSGGTAAGPTFAASTVYRALVTLSVKPGYTFTGVGMNNFIHMGADTATNGTNSGTVILTFRATAAVGSAAITVGFNYGEITITGSTGSNVISQSGAYGASSLSLSATGYTSEIWYVDGLPTGINGSSVTLDAADYTVQKHSIIFSGTANGHRYSSQPIPFVVNP